MTSGTKTKSSSALPLIVDLDGTLLNTDTLYELFVAGLFTKPISTFQSLLQLTHGRAGLKAALAESISLDFSTVPRNTPLVEFLSEQHAQGREIHLVTAADQGVADAIASTHGFFASVKGSSDGLNLKGKNKANYLQERFPYGFVYAGDSAADLSVWGVAKAAIPVAAQRTVEGKLKALGTPVENRFSRTPVASFWPAILKAMRLHQWSKNLLMFVPLFLAHVYSDPNAVLNVFVGFVLMGLVASGTYLLNDLSDLAADRAHATKRNRPFASGDLNILHGLVASCTFIALGLGLAFALNPVFASVLLVYLVLTVSYTLRLKRAALLDVFTLGILYTIRLFMGISLIDVYVSPWLIAFAFLFFYSLSLAKRHVEIVRSDGPAKDLLPGRGYTPSDWPLTLTLGIASGIGALIVIVLYLTEEAFPSSAYQNPEFLWAAPLMITLWMQRIWLLATRGELDDDPVLFAIKDRISILLGFVLAAFFVVAVV